MESYNWLYKAPRVSLWESQKSSSHASRIVVHGSWREQQQAAEKRMPPENLQQQQQQQQILHVGYDHRRMDVQGFLRKPWPSFALFVEVSESRDWNLGSTGCPRNCARGEFLATDCRGNLGSRGELRSFSRRTWEREATMPLGRRMNWFAKFGRRNHKQAAMKKNAEIQCLLLLHLQFQYGCKDSGKQCW